MLFSDPVMKDGVYLLYSAKKFFGIPDGAYLIGKNIISDEYTAGTSINYSHFLLVSYEAGTNAAYQMKKDSDRFIADNPGSMSKLALGLLKNVDYDSVFARRENNYSYLHERLKDVNQLNLPKISCPYHYPLLISGKGRQIKCDLISNKIYVPTLWNGDDLLKHGNTFELFMFHDAVFIPVDQQYDENDMEYLAEFISSCF